jgi:DNA repair protein RadC
MSQQLPLFSDLAQPAPVVKSRPAPAAPASTMLRQAVAEYLPSVTNLPPAERPRARLEHCGSGALSTAELLAVLLGTPHQIHDAERLLATLDGLPGIAMANWTELCEQPGIGPTCTARIKAALELGRRLLVTAPIDRPTVRSPADAANMLMPEMGLLDQEELRVVLLDTRNRVMAIRTVYRGSLNSASVRVGEVFKDAIRMNAAAILVCHNHPSQDASPSPEDVQVTRLIVEAGALLACDVVDHIIVTRQRFVSLRERGLGFK